MNDMLRKGILYAASALVMTSGFVFASVVVVDGSSNIGINSPSSQGAVFAQVKKKAPPVKGGAPQRQAGPNLNNPQINGYLTRMREKIDSNWELPDGKNKVTITATV